MKKKGSKKKIVIAIIAVLALLVGCLGRSGDDDVSQQDIEYTSYSIESLFDELDENAINAEEHTDEYIEVVGFIDTMDSDGSYVTIGADPDNYDYMFETIMCDITDDEQLEVIKGMKAGQKVRVKGKVSDVGELMGYTIDMYSISSEE